MTRSTTFRRLLLALTPLLVVGTGALPTAGAGAAGGRQPPARLVRLTLPQPLAAPQTARLALKPYIGPVGTSVLVTGAGFGAKEQAAVTWDSTTLAIVTTSASGSLQMTFTVPSGATPGAHTVAAVGSSSGRRASATFTVIAATPTPTPTPLPASNPPKWLPGPSLSSARAGLAVVTGHDGRVYLLGGTNFSGNLNLAEAYTPAKRAWTTLPWMSSARAYLAAVTGLDGRIYAIGGDSQGSVEAYNPAKNTWSAVASLRYPRSYLCAAVGHDGRIYAIGGLASPADGTAEVYTPATNSWAYIDPPLGAVSGCAAVTGADGRIYVFGSAYPQQYTSAYAYDPTADSWALLAPMIFSRYGPLTGVGAALGPDGLMYVLGGEISNVPTALVQVYAPATDTWFLPSADLSTSRGFLGATVAPDGRIYAIGGATANGAPLATSEIYGPAVTLSPSKGLPGASVAATGTSFGANATVHVYWGTAVTGTLLVAGTTDASGRLTASLTFKVPSAAKMGTAAVTVEDRGSLYPVNKPFKVT